MNDRYRVIYRGKLRSGVDPDVCIETFAKTFHLSRETAERSIRAGKEIVLKKDLDRSTAEDLRDRLEGMGLVVRIEPPLEDPLEIPLDAGGAERREDPLDPVFTLCPQCGSERFEQDVCLDCGFSPSQKVHGKHGISGEGTEGPEDRRDPESPARGTDGEEPMPGIGAPVAVPIGHGWTWLSEGFGYFQKNPWAWIGALLVWIGINLVAGFIPFLGSLGLQILSGVFLGGLMLGAQAQERGEDFQVSHLFAGFSQHTGPLIRLGILYLVGSLLIFFFVALAFAPFLMPMEALSMQELQQLEAQPQMMVGILDPLLLLLAGLVILALMIPLMMAYFFAPALIAIGGIPALEAMKLSFSGCLKNLLPFLWYGLLGVLLLMVAMIPFGLGLLVAVPILMASVYAAFRDIYSNPLSA